MEKIRILKKSLLFLIGLPRNMNNIKLLKSKQFFGQYGKIENIYIKEDVFIGSNREEQKSISVYVTYTSEISTAFAILALDKMKLNGNILKASFGRTRYCYYFLKN